MARDGSGNFTLTAGNPVPYGLKPLPSQLYNATFADLKNEMTDSLSRSGKGAMLAALAMGGFKITGLGTPTTGTDAATKAYADSTYAPLVNATLTGTVTLPSTTSIGAVSATEIGYLDGVTSAIQTQLAGKQASLAYTPANKAGETFAGNVGFTGSNGVEIGTVFAKFWDSGAGPPWAGFLTWGDGSGWRLGMGRSASIPIYMTDTGDIVTSGNITTLAGIFRNTGNTQPQFSANQSASVNSTGNVEFTTYSSTGINQGGGWNASTGRYTAPVTGTYLVAITRRLNGVAAVQSGVEVRVNGGLVTMAPKIISESYTATGVTSDTACLPMKLNAGEYISVWGGVGSVSDSTFISYFSACLIS